MEEIRTAFVEIVEQARRKVTWFNGRRILIPDGIKLKDTDGAVICEMADSDYLAKYRRHMARRRV